MWPLGPGKVAGARHALQPPCETPFSRGAEAGNSRIFSFCVYSVGHIGIPCTNQCPDERCADECAQENSAHESLFPRIKKYLSIDEVISQANLDHQL